jgi:hypothetical protein
VSREADAFSRIIEDGKGTVMPFSQEVRLMHHNPINPSIIPREFASLTIRAGQTRILVA